MKLDAIIQKFSNIKLKKISKYILNILRCGIYQMFFLDKIPVAAAVNESVELAKRYGHNASSRYVNGVLRNVKMVDFEDVTIEYSHPQWMFDMWVKDYGANKAIEIMKANNEEGEITYRGDEIQGLASQKAVEVLAPKSGEVVIDVCSAPGGKALYAAEMMKNKGRIIACDIHEHRVELIRKNAERVGADIIEPTLWDGTKENPEWVGKADRVLVDAPCSGLGTIHKKPDVKWKKTEKDISDLAKIQVEILENSAYYLMVGGKMVYSTCTVNKIENDNVVGQFLDRNTQFKLISQEQIFPSKEWDGFYIALMEREK
jgi:16S rRNA (cytosine967-C5)-methyltransferase